MFRDPRSWLMVLAGALASSACALEVSYTESHYACGPGVAECPSGFECSNAGWCELRLAPIVDAAEPTDARVLDDGALAPDAHVPPADAHVSPPDARMSTPDAALPPDAVPAPTTVSFTATRDTQLYSPNPTFNFGDFSEIICANETGIDSPVLFGFTLTSIPDTATVQSAVLHISTSTNALTGGSVTIYKLLEDWTEGTLDGAPGAASYNDRAAGTPWPQSGARGGSRASSSSAVFSPSSASTTYDVTLPAALVQAWVSSPASNYGVVMTASSGQDVAFLTRGTGAASQRPRLTITYVP